VPKGNLERIRHRRSAGLTNSGSKRKWAIARRCALSLHKCWRKWPAELLGNSRSQVVPYADSGPLSAKLLKNGTLKTYKGFPHGMPTTQAEAINTDLLAFIKG